MPTAPPSLNYYFQRIYCITLARTPDRWHASITEAARHGFSFERFNGYDYHDWDGYPTHLRSPMHSAMCGCSHSHAAIFALAAHNETPATLVLEDDFEVLHPDFTSRFALAWAEVPPDWDIVYLGAGYGEPPKERLSEHVVRAGYIKTTSSYAISARHARRMFPMMATCEGPDEVLSGYNPHVNAYVLHPRLMGQRPCMSAIWGTFTHNTQSMTDPHHNDAVERLPYHATTHTPP